MRSVIFGLVFWAVLLGFIWLIRPGSKLQGITMEHFGAGHRLVTVLVLAAMIGSSSYLMTLCPMWNGEITAQLMEEIEARKAANAANAGTAAGNAGTAAGSGASQQAAGSGTSETTAVKAGEEKWKAAAAQTMRENAFDRKEEKGDPDRFAIKNKNQYELLAEAILNGRIHLDYGDMDPRLLSMENPYDLNARRELGVWYHWDHAFYKGRYYMYFGVVPVFLLFIPYRLITGMSLTTYHATQIFVGLSMIGLFAFFRLLAKKFFPRLSFVVYLLLGAAVSLTGMVHCIAKPAMYMTAFSAAFCMEIWSIYFYVKAVWATESENRAVFRAFLGALLGALAFGCRPSIALANLVVIPCLIVFLRNRRLTGKLFLKLLAAASPYFIIGALLLAYNYVRFDSPFEFGQSYQLTVTDQSGYSSLLSRLSVRKLVNGFIYFLVRSEELTSEFPHIVEGGIFFSYPVFGAGLFALASKKVRAALRENRLVLFVLGAVFSIAVIILMDGVWSPYMLSRYEEDLMWLAGMLVFLLVGMRYAGAGRSPVVSGEEETCGDNAEFGFAVCLLAIYSLFVCAFVFVQLDMEFFRPEQIVLIKKIISGLTFGL